jgi:hypothetical protein
MRHEGKTWFSAFAVKIAVNPGFSELGETPQEIMSGVSGIGVGIVLKEGFTAVCFNATIIFCHQYIYLYARVFSVLVTVILLYKTLEFAIRYKVFPKR